MKPRVDPYQSVTDAIVKAIESDLADPIMPWHRGGAHGIPRNIDSGNQYQGINILNLWVTAQLKAYSSEVWGTYRQWQQHGCQVRKGEKSALIVFYKQLVIEEDGKEATRRVIKTSWGFNADQVDGYDNPALEDREPLERIAAADVYVAATKANIVCGGVTACYRPGADTIHMPDEKRFFDTATSSRTESYYNILLHELTHWSGAAHRLNRDLANRFGSEAYAMEELVAELGSAFQCAYLGITPEPRLDHAQYIKHWLDVLKKDKKAIFTAAARAQDAVEYLKAPR